jgi:hypothetical protein
VGRKAVVEPVAGEEGDRASGDLADRQWGGRRSEGGVDRQLDDVVEE